MIRLISWNTAHRVETWYKLVDSGVDIALLQEAVAPPADISHRVKTDSLPWNTSGSDTNRPWRTSIVQLSDRTDVTWYEPIPIAKYTGNDFAVSLQGTLAAATVKRENEESFTAISMYAVWEKPHPSTASSWIYADASVHRLISDISQFVGQQNGHQILLAGDLNILHGYGEHGNRYWAGRYDTVFSRMSALGLLFMGPHVPAGRQADPWPDELPECSQNVPTYRSNRQTPSSATRQLDFVFASKDMGDNIHVIALNDPEAWGPSDHCRVLIELYD